tara:strand:- start:145638 stop:146030 length:393 start_codon:yes stop_codon:yes gene_type:complete
MSDVLDLNFDQFSLRVIVHLDVIEQLKTFRQIKPKDVEACGLLLGRAYNHAIEVTAFTPPQVSDRRTRSSYSRKSKGHAEQAVNIWKHSSGLIGYLGEWHTHPEHNPLPSSKDLIESKKGRIGKTEKIGR